MSEHQPPYRILIVEDEEMILRTLEAFLQDEGYYVKTAANGEDSLDILAKEKVDLAIVDMRLPKIDGNIVILEALRLDPTIKFIIHTGSSSYTLPQELTNCGLKESQVLIKPLKDMSVLTDLIDKVMNNQLP